MGRDLGMEWVWISLIIYAVSFALGIGTSSRGPADRRALEAGKAARPRFRIESPRTSGLRISPRAADRHLVPDGHEARGGSTHSSGGVSRGEADYAGLLTFGGRATRRSASSAKPMSRSSELPQTTSFRTAGDAPRAESVRAASCPPGPHLEAGVDAFADLSVVDFGDAPVIPADSERSHAAIEATVKQVLAATPSL